MPSGPFYYKPVGLEVVGQMQLRIWLVEFWVCGGSVPTCNLQISWTVAGAATCEWLVAHLDDLCIDHALGLIVDHLSLSIIPTARQVQQFTKHVRASAGWHFQQSHSAS